MRGHRALTFIGFSVAASQAQFTLDYPISRGYEEVNQTRWCGGFSRPGDRSKFPISNGIIQITSTNANATFLTTITFEPKPKNTTGTLLLKPYLKLSDAGKYCYPVDIVRSTGADLREGDNATILIEYSAGDGYLYQCADITFAGNAPPYSACSNTTSVVGEQTGLGSTVNSVGSLDHQFGAAFAMSTIGIIAAAFL